jgi:hypothetical protein
MYNDEYYKYIKYKNKYINLKQQAGALSKNKKKSLKSFFPDTILQNDDIYLAHFNENYDLFLKNEKVIEHFLRKKINFIKYIKDEINNDIKYIKLLEQIDISYKNFKITDITEINKLLENKINELIEIKNKINDLFNIKYIDNSNKNNIINILKLFNRDLYEKNNYNNIKSYYHIKFFDKNNDLDEKIKKDNEIYKIINFCDRNKNDSTKNEILYPNENILILNDISVAKPGIIVTKRIKISGELIGFYINDNNDSIILIKRTDND